MRCLILFFVLFLGACAGQIPQDRIDHFAVGMLVSNAVVMATDDPIDGITSAFMVGLAKEIYDDREGGLGFSIYDLIATTLGGFLLWEWNF